MNETAPKVKPDTRTTPAGLPVRTSLRVAPGKQRRDSKRDALVRCAREEIAANGFAGTHLSVLAARVGIRKSSFFHYFPDKESLYDVAVASLLDDVADAVDLLATIPTFGGRLDELIECMHRNLQVEPIVAHLMLRAFVDAPPSGTMRPTGADRIATRIAEAIALGVSEGPVMPLDVSQAALNIMCILCTAHAPPTLAIGMPRTSAAAVTADMRIAQLRVQVRGLLGVR